MITLPILSCLGAHLLGIGAENLTLHTNYPSSTAFRASGYENISTNASYTDGVVRQFEGFSFSRVFEGNHPVSYTQPETTYQIFTRATFNLDVATGKVRATPSSDCSSSGPSSSFGIKNTPSTSGAWVQHLGCGG